MAIQYKKYGFASEASLQDEIIRLHNIECLDKRAICSRLSISYMTMHRLFKYFKIESITHSELHRKAGFDNKSEFLTHIKNLYSIMPLEEVATKVGTTYPTIQQYFSRNNLETRSISEYVGLRQPSINLTTKESEIVNGMLLGDGWINEHEYTGSIGYACKHEMVPSSLCYELPRLFQRQPDNIKFYDERTSKWYQRWRSQSIAFKEFLNLRHKWYPNSAKVIPNDIVLTAETCYWWYVGDGSSARNSLYLCTNGFTVPDVEMLISKMPVRSRLYMYKIRKLNKSYPMISITSLNDRHEFLKFIGPCRHSVYNYKWFVHHNDKAKSYDDLSHQL